MDPMETISKFKTIFNDLKKKSYDDVTKPESKSLETIRLKKKRKVIKTRKKMKRKEIFSFFTEEEERVLFSLTDELEKKGDWQKILKKKKVDTWLQKIIWNEGKSFDHLGCNSSVHFNCYRGKILTQFLIKKVLNVSWNLRIYELLEMLADENNLELIKRSKNLFIRNFPQEFQICEIRELFYIPNEDEIFCLLIVQNTDWKMITIVRLNELKQNNYWKSYWETKSSITTEHIQSLDLLWSVQQKIPFKHIEVLPSVIDLIKQFKMLENGK